MGKTMTASDVTRDDIVAMLRRAVEERSLTLWEFRDLAKSDRLEDPGLRDLWLIWGDVLREDDSLVAP